MRKLNDARPVFRCSDHAAKIHNTLRLQKLGDHHVRGNHEVLDEVPSAVPLRDREIRNLAGSVHDWSGLNCVQLKRAVLSP